MHIDRRHRIPLRQIVLVKPMPVFLLRVGQSSRGSDPAIRSGSARAIIESGVGREGEERVIMAGRRGFGASHYIVNRRLSKLFASSGNSSRAKKKSNA